ncbi:MAG: hypothetical protein JW940_05510 [Polyangiaceae bacterium]|nr:hypothetical protein [Polyangiaceae bacterium]
MSHGWSRCSSALFSLCAAACAGAGSSGLVTTTELPVEPSRAPGVAIEPRGELPAAVSSAPTAQSLTVLTAPASMNAARQVVRRFMEAVALEDEDGVGALLEPQAQMRVDARGTRWRAMSFWQARFARLDYTQLKGRVVYRESAIETYAAPDAEHANGSRLPPLTITPPQVLVCVPVLTRSVNGQTFFGDEIDFVLVPFGATFRIAAMAENFQLP